MGKETSIKVQDLTKTYKLYEKPIDRLKETLSLSKKIYHNNFDALKEVSFEVKKGETIGIIGKNGSGKSTLLKIITGILTETSGKVEVNGKVSAILELGAGFNPEYTGVENIYMQGTILGYSNEEVEQKLQSILAFADIGDFIYQPVKTYSSGMFVRLAFAVAINVEPEILIVDEALAVGDVNFQIKCINRMIELQKEGTTILFVSHATEQIKRFCQKAIWLDNGRVKEIGKASYIADMYEDYMRQTTIEAQAGEEQENIVCETSNFDEEVEIAIENNSKCEKPALIKTVSCNNNIFKTFEKLIVEVEFFIFKEEIENFLLGVAIYNNERKYIFGPNTCLDNHQIPNKRGNYKVRYIIPRLTLLSGTYYIDVGLFVNKGLVCLDYKTSVESFIVTNDYFSEGLVYIEHDWEVLK